MISKAAELYHTFIATGSPKEVNVFGGEKDIFDEMFQNGFSDLQRDSFDEIQKSVLHLMSSDTFQRFIHTVPYKELQKAAEDNLPISFVDFLSDQRELAASNVL